MESPKTPPSNEERFKENLIDLMQYIHTICSHFYKLKKTEIQPFAIEMSIAFAKGYDNTKLIDNYVSICNKYWDNIKDREESFFRDNGKSIFGPLPFDEVDKYVDMFSKLFDEEEDGVKILTPKHKNAVWAFHDSFVRIAIKHVHEQRCPKVKVVNGEKIPIYTKKYCEELKQEDFLKHAQKWEVELKFKSDKIEAGSTNGVNGK